MLCVADIKTVLCLRIFFFNDTATTEIYTLSLHDALPICDLVSAGQLHAAGAMAALVREALKPNLVQTLEGTDRKSTRLNSSHSQISYAVFCLKKKKGINPPLLVLKPGHLPQSRPDLHHVI